MMNLIDLYEDSDGGLHLHRKGDDVAYCHLERVHSGDLSGRFARDARALMRGDIRDWAVDTVPVSEVAGDIIATYLVEMQKTAVVEGDGAVAGRNGRRYLGLEAGA